MRQVYDLPRRMLEETFEVFRVCGGNRRECQLFWLSNWSEPANLVALAHPRHTASRAGLSIHSGWITEFWNELAHSRRSVCIQVHTHPGAAFHSAVDDAFPLLCHTGFLSLVIPDFALGPVGFDNAYLTEIQADGRWMEVAISSRISING
jgi:hypothetical protein